MEHVALRLERGLVRLRCRLARRAVAADVDVLLAAVRRLPRHWWVYAEGADEAGVVVDATTAQGALIAARRMGWDPRNSVEDGPTVHAVELGQQIELGSFRARRAA